MAEGGQGTPATPGDRDGANALSTGQRVGAGRYTLERLLGQGGMGVVWLAKDEQLGEEVALKFLTREISHDAEALEDLRQETLKSRKLTHPNIIRIHDLYQPQGEAPFISMEYVAGESLSKLKAQHPQRCFRWNDLLPLVAQLCNALDYAHEEHVIHRDLKPANMMLDAKGRLKLADFGLAAVVSESMSRLSGKSGTSGTPAYMSPQQMDGRPPRVTDDIYALGATLYELLTSKPPFYHGDIVYQVRNLPPAPLDQRLSDLGLSNEIPSEVGALIVACLSKEAEKRPQSARGVAMWIGLNTAHEPSVSQAGDLASPVQVQSDVEEETSDDSLEPSGVGSTSTGINKGPWIFAGVLAVVLLSLGAWLLMPKRGVGDARTTSVAAKPSVERNNERAIRSSPAPAAGEMVQAATNTNRPVPVASSDVHSAMISTPAGTLDPDFKAVPMTSGKRVSRVLVQPDGRIVVCGLFTDVGGKPRGGVARLNSDGTLDQAFYPRVSDGLRIYGLALQPDGKLLVCGSDGKSGMGGFIGRYTSSGAADNTFKPPKIGGVISLALQRDGKIIVAGSFPRIERLAVNRIARLNANGSLDTTFNPGTGAEGRGADKFVQALTLQPDGKVIIGGEFDTFNGIARGNVARLNANGSLDTSFDPGTGTTGRVNVLALQGDGKVLLGGFFTNVNGVARHYVARLNSDGSLDPTFNPSQSRCIFVQALALQSDGKIMVGGDSVVRLNSDGSPDDSFKMKQTPNGGVYGIALQPDRKLLVVGEFMQVNMELRPSIIRLLGDYAAER